MKNRDAAHLAFIRKLPCVKCGAMPCEAAHIRRGTDGGTSLKPGDDWTVPLCKPHHAEQHRIGEITFWGDIGAARQLARNLYIFSCFNQQHDTFAAVQAISKARTICFLF